MLRQFALALVLSTLAAPAWAIEEVPDDAQEEESYVPNRFSINLKASFVDFRDSRALSDTFSPGLRVGYTITPWVELQFGADYMKARVDVRSNTFNIREDVGDVRLVPIYADLRIDVTNIDPWIPWPCAWVRPDLIVGAGYMSVSMNEDSDFPGNVRLHSGAVLRAGLALTFCKRTDRVSFAVEAIYNWVENDIELEESPLTNNFPSRLNLDYLEFGAVLTLKF